MFASRILAVAAAVATLTPAAVFASPASDDNILTRQVHVRTADLDLNSAAGQRALQSRIRFATAQVCEMTETGHLIDSPAVKLCKQAALTNAKQQAANVTAVHASHYAQAKPAQAPANTASGS